MLQEILTWDISKRNWLEEAVYYKNDITLPRSPFQLVIWEGFMESGIFRGELSLVRR
jgi:hypothetical protein